MKKVLAIFILLCISALMLAGCGGSGERMTSIKNTGKLVVYTDPNFPPFEFHGADGIMGVDIRIAQAIADEIGVTLEIVEADFDSILMAISTGRGDIAIAGMTITDDRKQTVDFSVPYVDSVQYFILPANSDITIMEDLAGKRVGVAMGYTGNWIMLDETEEDDGVLLGAGTTIVEYNSALEAVLDMNNGRIDAVVMDKFVSQTIAGKDDNLKAIQIKYADGRLATEVYGVVVPKENKDLLDLINSVVQGLLDDRKIEEWIIYYSGAAS